MLKYARSLRQASLTHSSRMWFSSSNSDDQGTNYDKTEADLDVNHPGKDTSVVSTVFIDDFLIGKFFHISITEKLIKCVDWSNSYKRNLRLQVDQQSKF